MKRTIASLIAVLAATVAPIAHAEPPSDPPAYTIVLAGGSAENTIRIWLTPDGYEYVIDSVVPLEVGGSVCHNTPGNPNQLVCQAPLVAGFVVNAGPSDDSVIVATSVEVPATLWGGPGGDVLRGGSAADKLIGGPGKDVLSGRAGNDAIFGGPGRDFLNGGPGDDMLWGGPGRDVMHPGTGHDGLHEGAGRRATQ
jgi:Ca2+-binding RTX toxin-like protein